MDDWENEEISAISQKEEPKRKWDDEDVEDNDVKESWEDEDEAALAPIIKPPPKAASKKPAAKITEKKGQAVQLSPEHPLNPLAEKLCQQRLVEEADYKSTTQLFSKRNDEKTIDSFIPKSESEFLEYSELISHKLCPYEKSYHYINLLKDVIRLSITSLKAADAKDIASSVTAIVNEKLKVEKEATTGKKKKAVKKKKQLNVDKADDDDIVVKAYDNIDDYDFM